MSSTILFVAGGSGGHVQTALGVIDVFSSEDHKKVLFVGSNRAMEGETTQTSVEQRLTAQANIPFVAIRSGKLQRTFSAQSWKLLLGVAGGFIDSWRLLRERQPAVVISFGGYVSVPVVLIAWLLRIPVFLHEQTTSIGLANNIAAKVARKVFISYKQSAKFFPKEKVVFTGSPKRQYLFNPENLEKNLAPEIRQHIARIRLFHPDYPLIVIVGGSQGSHTINETVGPILEKLLQHYQVVIQTGSNQVFNDFDILTKLSAQLPQHMQKRLWVTPFLNEELALLYRYARLVVSRGGANFVYELGMFKLPSIIIPIPWVTNNEQYTNAQVLEKIGLGKILEEKDLSSESLYNTIEQQMHAPQANIPVPQLSALFPTNSAEVIRDQLIALTVKKG